MADILPKVHLTGKPEDAEPHIKWQGKRFMLTFKDHLDVNDITRAFENLIPKSLAVPQMKILHEIGSSGYKHTHVLCLFARRIKLESRRKWKAFRAELRDFHLKPISSDEHFQNCMKYEDAAKKSTLESIIHFDNILEWSPAVPYHDTVLDFIVNAKSWRDVLFNKQHSAYLCNRLAWARELFDFSHCRIVEDLPHPYDWQSHIIEHVTTPCVDDRTVHWIYDPIGGNGKSKLSNFLLANHNAFLVDEGKKSNIAYAYQGEPIVIFDLCRDQEDFVPYKVMESFKNKRIFSSKYKSVLKGFDQPHVIVFANFLPVEQKLSKDRWEVMLLNNYELSEYDSEEYEEALRETSQGTPYNIKVPPENVNILPASSVCKSEKVVRKRILDAVSKKSKKRKKKLPPKRSSPWQVRKIVKSPSTDKSIRFENRKSHSPRSTSRRCKKSNTSYL